MSKLEDILKNVIDQLGPGFISTEVVGMDGLSIAGDAANPKFDNEEISARLAIVMKLSTKVSGLMDIGEVEDNLVTTDKAIILARLLGDGTFYWRISVKKDTNLGLVRMLMKQNADKLWDSIPR